MTKPTVRYKKDNLTAIEVGYTAFIFPIDHPSNLVSNKGIVRTSKVVSVGQDGSFETQNTKYVLEDK